MKRNTFLDFVKGILILLVAIGHSIQFAMYQDSNFWDDPLFKAIYMFHMPLFMAICGYLAYPGILKSKLLSFSIRKAYTYIIPILVWTSLICIAQTILSSSYNLAYLPVLIFKKSVVSLWFLWALFGSLIVTVIAKTTERYFLIIYFFLLLIVLLLPEKGIIYLFKYTFPFFQIGYLVAAYGAPHFAIKHQGLATVIAGILSIACFMIWNKNTYIYTSQMALTIDNLSNIAFRFLASLIASVFFILFLMHIYSKIREKIKLVFMAFGRDSIYIYILQVYIFMAIASLAKNFLVPVTNSVFGAAISVCIGLAVTYACWLTGKIIARNNLARRLLFGKTSRTQ
jgi:fucose 4-O-acetylase-like acetyltransferase